MSTEYDVARRWRDYWYSLPMNTFMNLQLRNFDCASGRAVVGMPFRKELGNMHDNSGVHGGALAALIDAVSNFAVAIHTGGEKTLTSNLRVDYLAWARAETIVCEAQVVKCGRRSALVDVELRRESGEVLSVGRVSLSHRNIPLD